jgi:hypothetical protein
MPMAHACASCCPKLLLVAGCCAPPCRSIAVVAAVLSSRHLDPRPLCMLCVVWGGTHVCVSVAQDTSCGDSFSFLCVQHWCLGCTYIVCTWLAHVLAGRLSRTAGDDSQGFEPVSNVRSVCAGPVQAGSCMRERSVGFVSRQKQQRSKPAVTPSQQESSTAALDRTPHPQTPACSQAALGSGCTFVWQLLASPKSFQPGQGETWRHPHQSLPDAKRASQANQEGSAGSTREAQGGQ